MPNTGSSWGRGYPGFSPNSIFGAMMADMKKVEDLTHRLISTSCSAMCDGLVWTKGNHKLAVDCLDAYKDVARELKKPPGHTVTHFS